MNRRFKVVIGVDMETDVGSFSPYYEGVSKGTPKLLKMFGENNIEATFFFTGEAAQRNQKVLEEIKKAGHEIGAHSLYHETVGDEIFDNFGTKAVLPEELPLRIKKCTEIIENIAGERPVSFRSPRLWGSTALVKVLEDLGYVVDASYPMYFYREQFFPYHPSKKDWLKKGSMKILEIPNFADMLMKSDDPGLERDRDPWWQYRLNNADEHMKYINNFLKFTEDFDEIPVLCFYIHPWEFVKMPISFDYGECVITVAEPIVKGTGKKAVKEFDKLIKHLLDMGAKFYTAAQLAKDY